jgi:hypothetical protein
MNSKVRWDTVDVEAVSHELQKIVEARALLHGDKHFRQLVKASDSRYTPVAEMHL